MGSSGRQVRVWALNCFGFGSGSGLLTIGRDCVWLTWACKWKFS